MPEYRCALYAITDRWTEKGKEAEMGSLGQFLSAGTQAPGSHLHSVQNVPIFGGFSDKPSAQALLVIWERD